MAVGSDKVRILVTLPIDLKEKLEEAAKNENRSVSNYVCTLIQQCFDIYRCPAVFYFMAKLNHILKWLDYHVKTLKSLKNRFFQCKM